tara:strand:- start:3874 stop:4311 length:438 start_codon:yes stop_codon:yes gene_type:complete
MINVKDSKITSSNYDDLLILAKSSSKKNVRKIQRLSPFIKSTYDNYDQIISRYHLEPNPSRFKKQSQVIEGYFTPNPPTSIDKELDEMRGRKLWQCPFCGRPCKPRAILLDSHKLKLKTDDFNLYVTNKNIGNQKINKINFVFIE